MADNKLQIKISPKPGQVYDPSWGLLTLSKAEKFEFGIRQYAEALDPETQKLEAEKKTKHQALADKLRALDAENAKGQAFIDKKYAEVVAMHRGGILTAKEKDTYDANLKVYNDERKKREAARAKAKADHDKELKTLEEDYNKKKKALDDTYANVRWVKQLVGLGKPVLSAKSFNESMGTGVVNFEDGFPAFLEGGGNVYIEPFFEGDTPQAALPYGCYIKAIGTPAILAAQWTDTDNNNIDKRKIRYGSTVRLHIYTQGLYGQQIQVQFTDDDSVLDKEYEMVDSDDELKVYGAEPEARAKFKGNNPPAATAKRMKVPVDALEEDEALTPANALSGKLVVQDHVADAKYDRKPHVQKAMFDVFIDPFWEADGGETEIELYPRVYYTKKDGSEGLATIEYCMIFAGKDGEFKVLPTKEVGNQPILVGTVTTDIADFHPCRYDEIKVTVEKEISAMSTTDKRELIVYSKDDKENQMYTQPIELVAGYKENLAEVIVDLKALNTSECRYKDKPGDHTGHVIDITPFKGIKAWEASGWKNNVTVTVSSSGGEGSVQIIGAEHPFGYIEHNEAMLKFQAAYIYQARTGLELLKYFIPSIARSYSITIPVTTCHKGVVPLTFIVYPDIKWTLKIAFNFERIKIPKLETSVVTKEEYITLYLPIPGVVLQYVKQSVYFQQREIMGKKMTVAAVDLSLTAQMDQEDDDHYSTELSLSGDIKKKIEEQLKKLGVVGELLQKLFDGKPAEGNEAEQTGKPLSDKDKQKARRKLSRFVDDGIEEYMEGEISKEQLEKKRKKLEKGLKKNGFKVKLRPVVEPEITWPSVGMSFSWSLSEGKTPTAQKKYIAHKTGYKLEAALFADPIIGMGAKLDFIGLIAKAHPIATAIVLVIDAASSLAGVEINLYFQVEGKLYGEINGFLDTLTGDNTFNRDSLTETGEKVAKLGGSLKFILEGSIKMNKSIDAVFFAVSVEGEASLRAEAEMKLDFALHANKKGFYLQPVFTFEGLEIIATARIDVDVNAGSKADDEEEDEDDGSKVEGSYQVIDRVIKKLDPIELYE